MDHWWLLSCPFHIKFMTTKFYAPFLCPFQRFVFLPKTCRKFLQPLIHSAGSDHYFRTDFRPYVRSHFSKTIAKQNKRWVKIMITTVESVGLAEWIIDDTCLVLACFFISFYFSTFLHLVMRPTIKGLRLEQGLFSYLFATTIEKKKFLLAK